MYREVIGIDVVCPQCGSMLTMNVDISDNFLYDICPGCGYKRKKNKKGHVVAINEVLCDDEEIIEEKE